MSVHETAHSKLRQAYGEAEARALAAEQQRDALVGLIEKYIGATDEKWEQEMLDRAASIMAEGSEGKCRCRSTHADPNCPVHGATT